MKRNRIKKMLAILASVLIVTGVKRELFLPEMEKIYHCLLSSNLNVKDTNPLNQVGIPPYNGEKYVILNGNIPDFTIEEMEQEPFEFYSELDTLGRCGYAEAMIDRSIMPIEERGEIGMIKPSGWHTIKYDCIDGKYLYNRCHLIAYQLTGENANEKNLITGTRYFNVEGMLPYENIVADYIRETGNRVLYKVTPYYDGNNLIANGVQMEAQSVSTDDIHFNVFVYNVQPGININYATGDSLLE